MLVATVLVGLAGALAAVLVYRGGSAPPPVRVIRGIDEKGNLRTFRRTYRDLLAEAPGLVYRRSVSYVASDGSQRIAYLVLPR